MRRVSMVALLALAPLIASTPTRAQRVESSLYNSMLGALLSHSVPEVSVQLSHGERAWREHR